MIQEHYLYVFHDLFQARNLNSIPEDVAKTSLPQQWHQPRGGKIAPKPIGDVTVFGFKAGKPTRGITSTLYNPINNPLDPYDLVRGLESVGHVPFCTAVPPTLPSLVKTKFGNFPLGSILSYQQAD